MEKLQNLIEYIHESPLICVGWLTILSVLVLVLLYHYWKGEKFLGEHRSAPLSTQLPTSQLGIGLSSRFQEFSSTNQGGSHVVGEIAASEMEHMTGSSEAPVFYGDMESINEYQNQTSRSSETEDFSNRPLFSDAFGNPEAKLNSILHGH